MVEIFKQIDGFEGYEVSNKGRVKSLKFGKEKILKFGYVGGCKGKRYPSVAMRLNKKSHHKYVHRLVAHAFLGELKKGLVVDHIDNNPNNNRLGNLQIVTQRTNLSRTPRGTSKYTGVYKIKDSSKWNSQIWDGKYYIQLGRYESEEEAHEIYQERLKSIK